MTIVFSVTILYVFIIFCMTMKCIVSDLILSVPLKDFIEIFNALQLKYRKSDILIQNLLPSADENEEYKYNWNVKDGHLVVFSFNSEDPRKIIEDIINCSNNCSAIKRNLHIKMKDFNCKLSTSPPITWLDFKSFFTFLNSFFFSLNEQVFVKYKPGESKYEVFLCDFKENLIVFAPDTRSVFPWENVFDAAVLTAKSNSNESQVRREFVTNVFQNLSSSHTEHAKTLNEFINLLNTYNPIEVKVTKMHASQRQGIENAPEGHKDTSLQNSKEYRISKFPSLNCNNFGYVLKRNEIFAKKIFIPFFDISHPETESSFLKLSRKYKIFPFPEGNLHQILNETKKLFDNDRIIESEIPLKVLNRILARKFSVEVTSFVIDESVLKALPHHERFSLNNNGHCKITLHCEHDIKDALGLKKYLTENNKLGKFKRIAGSNLVDAFEDFLELI